LHGRPQEEQTDTGTVAQRSGACPRVDWRDSKADGIRVFVLEASHDLLEEPTQLGNGRTGT